MHFVSKRNCIYRKDHPPDGIDITSPTKESGIYSTLNKKKTFPTAQLYTELAVENVFFIAKLAVATAFSCYIYCIIRYLIVPLQQFLSMYLSIIQ